MNSEFVLLMHIWIQPKRDELWKRPAMTYFVQAECALVEPNSESCSLANAVQKLQRHKSGHANRVRLIKPLFFYSECRNLLSNRMSASDAN